MKRNYLHFFLFLTILCCQNCRQKQRDESAVVQSIRQTGRLVTAEYTLQKMVKAADNQTWYKVGDRSILISVQAVVKAGIDLQQVTKENVSFQDSVMRVQLPKPAIFSVSLPPEKIRVLFEDVAIFRSRFSAAEREGLLRQAETQVRRLADSLGILRTAQENAATFLRRLLLRPDIKEVKLEFST